MRVRERVSPVLQLFLPFSPPTAFLLQVSSLLRIYHILHIDVPQIPEEGTQYGLTVNDYDYIGMPEEQDGTLTVLVTTGAGEQDGILFQSSDQGATWAYEGVSQP